MLANPITLLKSMHPIVQTRSLVSGSIPLTDPDPDPGGPKTYGSGSATLFVCPGKKSGIRIHEDAGGNIYTVGVTSR